MNQNDDANLPQPGDASAPAERVSLRELYASAMREVLEDPQKAVAEHEPWLLSLLRTRRLQGTDA